MLPAFKAAIAIIPASFTNGATATPIPVDTKGYDFATFDVFASTADVVSNTLSVLKLQESDDTVVTNFADVSGFKGQTDFTIATNAYTSTTNQNLWKLNVDCRARKRYLRLQVSPQTTMVIGAVANLGRPENTPTNSAQSGALNMVAG